MVVCSPAGGGWVECEWFREGGVLSLVSLRLHLVSTFDDAVGLSRTCSSRHLFYLQIYVYFICDITQKGRVLF